MNVSPTWPWPLTPWRWKPKQFIYGWYWMPVYIWLKSLNRFRRYSLNKLCYSRTDGPTTGKHNASVHPGGRRHNEHWLRTFKKDCTTLHKISKRNYLLTLVIILGGLWMGFTDNQGKHNNFLHPCAATNKPQYAPSIPMIYIIRYNGKSPTQLTCLFYLI